MSEVIPAAILRQNLKRVLESVEQVCVAAGRTDRPRLVAVGKTFPAIQTQICYEEGQRHFGENYVQELEEKSATLAESCPDIQWHFIGKVQTNKIKKLVDIPNLAFVETLESEKQASTFQRQCAEANKVLNVFVQVNTSGEENKGGVEPSELQPLIQYILSSCPNLVFKGLMTIGSISESKSEENRDFALMVKLRQDLSNTLSCAPESIELSMGMSTDFPVSIRYGSTNIRVGSVIFGGRYYPTK